MTAQMTLAEALAPPAARIWSHAGCGGYVRFLVDGGFCLRCDAGPLQPGQYEKARDVS